jgi:hypothetical protein
MPMMDVQGAMTIYLGEGDVTIARYNGDEPPYILFYDKFGRMTTIRSCTPEAWLEVKKIVDEVCEQVATTT